jgi:CYTH domain-containing protein
MAKEIERKFLVTGDAWRTRTTSATRFRQAYIVTMADRSVRIRLMDDSRAKLTLKIGKNALARDEFEYDIAVEDALDMIANAVGIVIEKTRYTVEHQGFVWEVDVYQGVYDGLVVAEVELRSESDSPDLPAWIGREVTGDRRYSNQTLATENFSRELCHGLSHSA